MLVGVAGWVSVLGLADDVSPITSSSSEIRLKTKTTFITVIASTYHISTAGAT
jgi:hypothetical protein